MTNASGLDSFTRSDAKNHLTARIASGQSVAEAATTTLEELKQRETAFGFIPVGGAVSKEDQAKLDAQIAIIKELQASIKALQDQSAKIEKQNELIGKVVQNQQRQAPQPPQQVRPQVAPLPAATAP
jgi:hypothetical protein